MALNQKFHPVSTCILNWKMVLFQTEKKNIQIWYKTVYAPYFCVCAYTSRSITLGSSIARLMSIKKVTASRPSISLWSYVKASNIIGRITIWNYKIIKTYTCIHVLFQGESLFQYWHGSYKCRVIGGKKSWFKCSSPTWSFTTTGLFFMVCIPNIALWGWLIMGVPNRDPKTPPLLMENVPPSISSIANMFFFAFQNEK